MKRKLIIASLVLLVIAGGFFFRLDHYQKNGTIKIVGLDKPVKIYRDEKGIPYIVADNLNDAFFAQGWVIAQDRLFQLEVVRLIADGRLSEVAGQAVLAQDKIIRAVDLRSVAEKNRRQLNSETLAQLTAYANGINAYIAGMQSEFPATLKLNGIKTIRQWTVEDLLATTAFSDWITGGTYEPEILRTLLQQKLGIEKAALLDAPVLKPAAAIPEAIQKTMQKILVVPRDSTADLALRQRFNPERQAIGSNTWVVDGKRTASGKPLLANDPHLDPRILPGTWYPLAIFTPEWTIAGATGGTLPGVSLGRNQFVAWGVTNSYGDGIDLYEEQLDKNNSANYLNNGKARPFTTRQELFRVRDPQTGKITEQTITIRYTVRGPLLNDLGLLDGTVNPQTEKLVSLRAAISEFSLDRLGSMELNFAKNLTEARAAIGNISAPINFSIVDREGNIGIQSSGLIPRRSNPAQAAIISSPVENLWSGKLAASELPNIINPTQGFAIAANQYLPDKHYPHYFSAYGAHSFRYQRISDLLNNKTGLDMRKTFAMQHDSYNPFAANVVPVLQANLQQDNQNKLAEILSAWNYHDSADQVAPAIFQSLIVHIFKRTYADELGATLASDYLDYPYLWQNSLQHALLADSSYFDNIDTLARETKADIIRAAAADSVAELTRLFDSADMSTWQWGKLHRVWFKGPALPLDALAPILGRAPQPFDGSGETIKRAKFPYQKPYDPAVIQSLIMVIDMGIDETFILNIPGGNSGRQFTRDLTAMLDDFLTATPSYLYFDRALMEKNARHQLNLEPAAAQ